MSAIEIRYGTLDDVPQIVPLFERYREFYGEAPRPEASRQFLEDRFFLGESKLFIAVEGGAIVGFTQLFPSFSSVTLQRMWILNDLYVDLSSRGRGTGRSLLDAAAHFGRRSGAKQLFIEGAVDNQTARSLYERFGFVLNSEYYYHYPLVSA